MTAPLLLGWISLALVVQLVLGIAVAVRTRGAHHTPVESARTAQAAWPGVRTFRIVARNFEDAAQSQCSFLLAPADGETLPPFKPGQFLTFAVPIAIAGDDVTAESVELVTRNYSLSDAPRADGYRITVKRARPPLDQPDAPAGLVSSYLHDRAMVGTLLDARAPSGQFVLDPDPSVPVVLIGGGIGVTPLLSMLQWCLAEQPHRHVTLFYGVRSSADHAFREVLRDLAATHPLFDLHVLYGAPDAGDVEGRDYTHTGLITLGLIERVVPAGRHLYYVCGPSAMMATIVPGLEAAGVAAADIHFEAFGPASVRRRPVTSSTTQASFAVQFRESERTVMWDGTALTLLDFAESNGIAIAAGCRSGSCGTCETRLVAGHITYEEPPEYDVSAGFCLPCVGIPASAIALDA